MRCAVHPDALAVDTCTRCGGFTCDACLQLLGEEAFCATCYQRREVTGRASARATIALLLAGGGLFFGVFTGVPALLLAWREAKAIERGDAPLSSRAFVTVARVLGWVSVALTVLGVGALVVAAVLTRGQLS